MDIVAHNGSIVSYNDPYIPTIKTNHGTVYQSVSPTKEVLKQADLVILTTNHAAFDLKLIAENSNLIVDLRNMINEASDKVYKL